MALFGPVSYTHLDVYKRQIVWGSSRVKVGLYFRRSALKISTLPLTRL